MLTIPAFLISAMIAVESGGNNFQFGTSGELGCLQISGSVVEDVNHIQHKRRYTAEDLFDRKSSIEILRIYVGHYCSEERLGRKATPEDICRIWNGGPRGCWKPWTLLYWWKIKKQLGWQ